MSKLTKEYEEKLPKSVIERIIKNAPKSEAKLKKIFEKALQEYNEMKVAPGESVGLVAAESIGEPGTQMCVSFNEKLIIKFNDSIHIVKTGEFVDSVLDSGIHQVVKAGDYEFCDVEGISVLALNENEKLEWKKVSKLNRHRSPKQLLKIKTKSGRCITATDFHSFVTRKKNEVVPIAGKDLKIGDRIPVIKYLPENCTKVISVCEYVDLPAVNDFRITKSYNPIKLIPSELDLDWNFGWFTGAYLAEGTATTGQLSISNMDNNYINNAKLFINQIGLDYVEKYHNRGFAPSRDFVVNSSLLAKFIRNSCGAGSTNKKVPEFAFSAKEEFVSGLLKGYFDGDGNFSVNRRMIRVSSNSEELLDGIKLLLTRFGIFAFKSKDHKQDYLMIPYKYAPIFLEKVGSDIEHKKNNLKKLAELARNNVLRNYQDYTDMISGFDNILIDLSRKLGLPTRYVNSATKRQKIGRTALVRHTLRFEKESDKKNVNISSELKILKRMAYSDVVWDEIEKIEHIETPHKYVYDLTVPGLHTFTTFDGIVTHNTLNTFHFAGVAEMNVTMGLPRLIEILDGRKTLRTPMMEIYLKSPYRYGKDIKKIALSIKETKLSEIVKEFIINIAESKIEVKLNEQKIKDINLTEAQIIKALKTATKGINIDVKEKTLIIKMKGKETDFNEIYKLKEKLKDTFIKGVKGISQVLPIKKQDEFIIVTAGSNLRKVLEIEEVDETRTITNNIFEIRDGLGIEAARQAIINEAFKVIENQGLNVDIRHLMLVADTMCFSGNIKGITRYGIVKEKSSVLARASFETPIKHIINASLIGETDNLTSVVENVMLNQPVPVGTGLPGLIIKTKETK